MPSSSKNSSTTTTSATPATSTTPVSPLSQPLFRDVYLFRDMNAEELALISNLVQSREFQAGEIIFKLGDQAQYLYVIQSGSVQIQQHSSRGDVIEIARLGKGSHFGEMAFVDGESRSASAMVLESSTILCLEYKKLNDLLESHEGTAVKFFRSLSHFLCGRLRITTNDLSFARESNLRYF